MRVCKINVATFIKSTCPESEPLSQSRVCEYLPVMCGHVRSVVIQR